MYGVLGICPLRFAHHTAVSIEHTPGVAGSQFCCGTQPKFIILPFFYGAFLLIFVENMHIK